MISVEMTSVVTGVEARAASYLVCELRGGIYGIEALSVREVLPLPAITPTSGTPLMVRGVVDVRGTLVSIVDLSALLGLPSQRPCVQDVLVVLHRGPDVVGVIVNAVHDVQVIELLNAAPQPDAPVNRCVAGLARIHGGIAQILHLAPLFEASHESNREARSLHASTLEWEATPPEERAVFEARAAALSRDKTANGSISDATADEGEMLLAAVALNGEYFGLDLQFVREFSPLRARAPVPCSPPFIAGLMNLRGETLTLLDIRPSLHMMANREDSAAQVVVIECEELRAGVLVDEVLDVWAAHAESVLPAPAGRDETHLLRGAVAYRGKMLGVLDLPRLLEELNQG